MTLSLPNVRLIHISSQSGATQTPAPSSHESRVILSLASIQKSEANSRLPIDSSELILRAIKMDNKAQVTVISVHSPLIQFSSNGGYYTSYAISLKSSNQCFTHSFSQARRRYSEFLHLRHLLLQHHPTMEPPSLPPKNYFYRFSDTFIEERKTGLQKFLEKILATPVYLSDKSLHLFLQTSLSMSQISKECLGDAPRPHLMDEKPFTDTSYHSDSSSSESTAERPVPPHSVDSSACSSTASSPRRVSFHDSVTVAVVCDRLWSIAVRPIRAEA